MRSVPAWRRDKDRGEAWRGGRATCIGPWPTGEGGQRKCARHGTEQGRVGSLTRGPGPQ
jgi:hypothetical protein